MRNRLGAVLALILTVGLMLSACGGPDENSPEGVTERFFDRLGDLESGDVSDLLCEDYRRNVDFSLPENSEADLNFDLKYDADDVPEDPEPGDVVTVEVWGEVEAKLRGDHIRYELKQRNDENAAWQVRVTRFEDEWQVCGLDPFILELLDINDYYSRIAE